jgi:hypothetical protein
LHFCDELFHETMVAPYNSTSTEAPFDFLDLVGSVWIRNDLLWGEQD